MKNIICLPLLMMALFAGCTGNDSEKNGKPGSYSDSPYIQDYSIKYYTGQAGTELKKVFTDRNGYVQILGSDGLFRTAAGDFLVPGRIVRDTHYRPLSDKKISGLTLFDKQFVYTDDSAVLSNAWAGKLFMLHNLPGAELIESGDDFTFLISDGKTLELLNDSGIVWKESTKGETIRSMCYFPEKGTFFIQGLRTVMKFTPTQKKLETFFETDSLTCMAFSEDRLIIGTSNGYLEVDPENGAVIKGLNSIMPCPDLTVIKNINGSLWFGSSGGAMKLRDDGRFDYYASERWLPSDTVCDISEGPGNSVLILTAGGLARICFSEMTLYSKAVFYEKQVRERHIRNGFNATVTGMSKGDLSTGSLEDSDNDGLWTSMYLAAEAFRYKVTGEDEALKNVNESLDAMERLFTVNGIPGFPSRSFERRGYKYDDQPWRRADDPEWDWKSTTSSDEAIGHIFAYGVIAELIDDEDIRAKAIMLIDTLMSHIVKNNFYLVDWDGKPTRWGRWNPEYVNSFPEMIGDRKLNSSNIIGMLQTAWHFTGKEKYRQAAFALMNEYGYLKNLMQPMKNIGLAPGEASDLSRLLSDGWNHSDDEMYYCGYWGLYRYAFNDTLRSKYREAIIDHWESETPEKEGLWNIFTALTGKADVGLDDAIWYLKEYPLDLIDWNVENSSRMDIKKMEPNFRNQTITEVLPPDELRIERHNANRFGLDGGGGGTAEYSAGDIWLLPYWMGRYLGIINPPVSEN